jgi:glycosyltransferase involved in cell wall biosynthesis
VRIAVYDRYWSTLGGGEQFAGGIAIGLARHHDVTLIGPERLDTGRANERLALDLSGLPVRLMEQESDVTALSAEYDILVNCTYQSIAMNRARRGICVVHFPGEVPRKRTQRLDSIRARLQQITPPTVVLRRGFYQPDRRGAGRRTDGAGLLDVYASAGMPVTLTVRADRATTVELWDGRRLIGSADLRPDAAADMTFEATGASPQQATIESDTVPYEARPGVVWRYGVWLESVRLGDRVSAAPPDRLRTKLLKPARLGHLDTYDTIASNSCFTAHWVERLWGRPSEVLYPPVPAPPISEASKEHIILNVGRFFDPRRGHSKKQLEMVDSFHRLHESGRAGDWTLHLVGGANPEDRDYAMAVKRAAAALPIHVHLSAPGEVLRDLLDRSSLYWHAAGLGEDPEVHPDRFEHFGISVVEAMAASAVPIVYGAAGPAEVVRDGVDGRHFNTGLELVELSAALMGQPEERARLAESARRRAEHFSSAVFQDRLDDLIQRVW